MAQQTNQRLKTERKKLITEILADDMHGKKIYLIGSAEFGPTNEPIMVKSSVGLRNKFGKQGSLIKAFHALKYTSKTNDVYLVKTTGEHSVAYLNVNIQDGEIIEDGFTITASESNEAFDETQIIVDIDSITIIHPSDLISNKLIYKYKDYPTVERLANAINKDTKQKRSYMQAYFNVDPGTPTQNAFFVCNPTSVFLYGGQCGLNYSKDLLYNCLNRTYEILESEDIDIIIPVDAFMDDIYPDDRDAEQYAYNMKYYQSTKDYLTEDIAGNQLSYMNQLINFCIVQLNFGVVTTGIMGYNSCYDITSEYLYESDEIVDMLKACFEYNLACCDNPFYAFLVSVVAGDIKYNKGTIIDNGYLAYAALCADTIYTTGTTNIPISESISLHNEFSEEKLRELADTGIVAFRHSPLYDEVVVYDGITASPENENLKLYCNVRMIQMCISYINKLFQFYIGQNMYTLIKDYIISNDLNNILEAILSKEIITEYDFDIFPNYAKGEVKVYLSLLTSYMVKSVKICSVINLEFDEEGVYDG